MPGITQKHTRHYCIFRTDAIGDVLLTLPMAETLKRHNPRGKVTMVVREYVADLVRLCPFVDEIITIPNADISSTKSMIEDLRAREIDVAFFAFPRPKLSYAVWRAKILFRVGTAHRWYSGFYNIQTKDHRSDAAMHESEYNIQLLEKIGIKKTFPVRTAIKIPGELKEQARLFLDSINLPRDRPFVILHPGSGGSAMDWSADRFGELGKMILEKYPAHSLLVTGLQSEAQLIDRVKSFCPSQTYSLPKDVSLRILAGIIAQASCLIANSTGPLHIAAAVDIPTIGLYPNKRVCNPRRWGPLSEKAIVFTPQKDPSCSRCERNACPSHDRMEYISVETVFSALGGILNGTTVQVVPFEKANTQ